jgi:Zn ribbon nucleic-acid-binding protein
MNIVGNCPLCEQKGLHVMGPEKAQIQQCIACGYTTTSLLVGSVDDNESFDKLSDDMKKWAKEENGRIWIPSMITLPFGMLYPFDDNGTMKWSLAEMVDISEDEQKNYPKEDGEGFYEKRFDTDNAKIFDEFVLALSALNEKAKEEINGENEV